MQRIHFKCLCQLLQVSHAHLLNKQSLIKEGWDWILLCGSIAFRSCTVEKVCFFFHSPMFLCNKHSNCTGNAGLGNLQDEGLQPLVPRCAPVHLACSVCITGGSGLWWGVSLPPSPLPLSPVLVHSSWHNSEIHQRTAHHLWASPVQREDRISLFPLKHNHSSSSATARWSFTKTCTVTQPWTGESLLPMGCNNKH